MPRPPNMRDRDDVRQFCDSVGRRAALMEGRDRGRWRELHLRPARWSRGPKGADAFGDLVELSGMLGFCQMPGKAQMRADSLTAGPIA